MLKVLEIEGTEQYPFITTLMKILLNIFVLIMWYLMVKNPPAIAGDLTDTGSIPGLGGSPGGQNGNPLQYSCPENPRDRGVWQAIVHGTMEYD